MEKPLQITFHGLAPSDAIEARIRAKAQSLEKFSSPLMSCHVTVQAPPGHQHKGGSYAVHVDVRVPSGELVISREHGHDHAHEDVYVAVRDAFDAVARQLEDYRRRQRGQVKQHEAPVHGTISKLFRDDGYGFAQLPDGTDVYFHENSVVDAIFANLQVGAEVRLVLAEGEGNKGPQASTVTPIGKHHVSAQRTD
jgi:ribosomal subunit interface protein